MRESLQVRKAEGKTDLTDEEIEVTWKFVAAVLRTHVYVHCHRSPCCGHFSRLVVSIAPNN
jgi:uncharacterized protein YbbK (DUF523 family)